MTTPVPAQQTPLTKGTVDGVACPWCGQAQDFKDQEDYALEPRAFQFSCDKCNGVYEIARALPVTILWLRRWTGGATHKFEPGPKK